MKKLIVLLLALLPTFGVAQYTTRSSHIFEYRPLTAGAALQGNRKSYFIGDTLFFELGGSRYGIELYATGNNYVLGYDSATQRWKGISVGGGGGGPLRLDEILDPITGKTFTIGTSPLQFATSGSTPNYPQFYLSDATTGAFTRAFAQIATGASNLSKPIKITAQGTTNGVEMNALGSLDPIGTGVINANKYKGNTLISSSDLAANVALEDASNTFTSLQTISGTFTGGYGLAVVNSATGSTSGGVVSTAAGSGYGVRGNSTNGVGGRFTSGTGTALEVESTSGTMASLYYNSSARLHLKYDKIEPVVTNSVDLGTSVSNFDTLFVDNISQKQTGQATLGSGDSVNVYVRGALNTWTSQISFLGGQGADGICFGYFTADTLHIKAELSQPYPNRVVSYAVERAR